MVGVGVGGLLGYEYFCKALYLMEAEKCESKQAASGSPNDSKKKLN